MRYKAALQMTGRTVSLIGSKPPFSCYAWPVLSWAPFSSSLMTFALSARGRSVLYANLAANPRVDDGPHHRFIAGVLIVTRDFARG